MKSHKYVIGIDEVGRGPIAGPVTLCAFLIPASAYTHMMKHFAHVKDSKKLSPYQRQVWFKEIKKQKQKGLLDYKISSVSSQLIDRRGLSWAVSTALRRCLYRLKKRPTECKVLLDGSLYAPSEFKNQKTIIKGDERIKIIALASIAAKVTRDKRLDSLAKIYPGYDFHIHKGYGTKAHYKKISLYGPCQIHRMSFLG